MDVETSWSSSEEAVTEIGAEEVYRCSVVGAIVPIVLGEFGTG